MIFLLIKIKHLSPLNCINCLNLNLKKKENNTKFKRKKKEIFWKLSTNHCVKERKNFVIDLVDLLVNLWFISRTNYLSKIKRQILEASISLWAGLYLAHFKQTWFNQRQQIFWDHTLIDTFLAVWLLYIYYTDLA